MRCMLCIFWAPTFPRTLSVCVRPVVPMEITFYLGMNHVPRNSFGGPKIILFNAVQIKTILWVHLCSVRHHLMKIIQTHGSLTRGQTPFTHTHIKFSNKSLLSWPTALIDCEKDFAPDPNNNNNRTTKMNLVTYLDWTTLATVAHS